MSRATIFFYSPVLVIVYEQPIRQDPKRRIDRYDTDYYYYY
jgi:hypothetical protein